MEMPIFCVLYTLNFFLQLIYLSTVIYLNQQHFVWNAIYLFIYLLISFRDFFIGISEHKFIF